MDESDSLVLQVTLLLNHWELHIFVSDGIELQSYANAAGPEVT